MYKQQIVPVMLGENSMCHCQKMQIRPDHYLLLPRCGGGFMAECINKMDGKGLWETKYQGD
jgi:hypothetical protein